MAISAQELGLRTQSPWLTWRHGWKLCGHDRDAFALTCRKLLQELGAWRWQQPVLASATSRICCWYSKSGLQAPSWRRSSWESILCCKVSQAWRRRWFDERVQFGTMVFCLNAKVVRCEAETLSLGSSSSARDRPLVVNVIPDCQPQPN